jgi:hypothetical protein
MVFDYSEAPPPRDFELVPHGTIATVQLTIRAGNAGEGGLLKRSAKGDCEMLDCEFVVLDGPYTKRKFWERMIMAGTTDGHAKAAEVSRGRLRTILESARGIKPDDLSPEARAARTVELRDFDGMRFIAKVGIERGKLRNDGAGENYPDKNILAAAITVDKRDWHPIDQAPSDPPFNSGGTKGATAGSPATAPAIIEKPAWAS